MFDKEAITALQEGESISSAAQALNASCDTNDLTALPSDFKLHDLEKYKPMRRRERGTMNTNVIDAFTSYVKDHVEPGATVFVNPDEMSATAVLNLGTPCVPGHADNRAKLTLKRTAAYSALVGIASGAGYKQTQIAEFLEDWPEHIQCHNGSSEITLPKAIAAIRKVSIEAIRKIENSEQQLSASRSAFESVQATSVDPLPTVIMFDCQPYADLKARTFALRLNVQTGGDKPTISLRIVKAEQHAEDMANELGYLIAHAFDGAPIPVLLGSYSKAE
ncbi:MAG: hypothetical protein RL710_1150 [Pseudomonadota bacterium]|jgi:uncharacterized protein YfdQ (DUF2303 family)